MGENEKTYLDWEGLLEYHGKLETELSKKANTEDLADVATSGDYNDLDNTPTNVSLFTNDAGYMTSEIDNTNGHDYVEIGGIKWATMNIGAENITDIGLYFQWGDILGYTSEEVGEEKNFTWEDYKFNPSGDGTTFSKYNSTDLKTSLDIEDDAAANAWGSDWRVPTTSELQTLSNAVNVSWTNDYEDSGVPGLILTDKEDSSKVLFLPVTGVCNDGSIIDDDTTGFYWSKSLGNTDDKGFGLGFDETNGATWNYSNSRSLGFAIRPVLKGPAKRTIMGVTQLEKDKWNNSYSKEEIDEELESMELVISTSLNDLNTRLGNADTNLQNLENSIKYDNVLGTTISPAERTAWNAKVDGTSVGSANGVASLDSNGKVPSSQLPSYVDDIVEGYLYEGSFYEESTHETEISGESGKIYVDLATNKEYRWSGSQFVIISETLALGETSSTAYRGDYGKIAYDHSQSVHARTDATKTEASETNGNIKINGEEITVYTHPGSGTNPHNTTKADLGLDNVTNDAQVKRTEMGANNGVATLDSSGKVPSSLLPSYVDDVIEGYYYDSKFYEESTYETEITGESGKIYVDLVTDKTYRWSGSTFAIVSETLALGETSSTAYRGDRGKIAYDHSQLTNGNPHNVTKSDVGLGNVGNFKAVSTEASQGLSSEEQSNARANIGAGTSSFSGSYDDLTNKPTIPDAQIQSDWNLSNTDAKDFIKNKPTIPDALIQSDWNQSDSTSKDFIKNKPGIGVANGLATLDSSGKVPSSQLPSYVDDVIEGYYHDNKFYNTYTDPVEGDDAAQAAWGEGWRMPTKAEFQALGNAVNTAWTNDYQSTGVAGMICTAKDSSGAQLFFPAAGYCLNSSVDAVGSYGGCWSSSLFGKNAGNACSFNFASGNVYWDNFSGRYYGCPIRPILASGDSTRPYVEIGGVKWSTMNIGASTETDAGLYFQWGDTLGYTASQVGTDKIFDWETYKYGDGTSDPGAAGMTKYNSTDGLTTLTLGTPESYSDEITAETGKIYVDISTNQNYRWSGSTYIVISSPYVLPTASANTLGGVKVGDNLSIDQNGVLSAESVEVVLTIGTSTTAVMSLKGVTDIITENEEIVSTALNELSDHITNHTHASSAVTAMTGYEKAANGTPITSADTLNQAVGKLEKMIDELKQFISNKERVVASALIDLDDRLKAIE